MEATLRKINYNPIYQPTKSHSVNLNNLNNKERTKPQEGLDKRVISNKNYSNNISFDFAINYNSTNVYSERQVIDMDDQIKTEIDKLINIQRNVYIVLFLISIVIVVLSWIPTILTKDISIVVRPLSLAFTLMIVLSYYLGRAK